MSEVPAGYRPKTDVQLAQTAQEAVQMTEKWMNEHNQPAVGRDGRILFSYGAGLPTVVCAPLRVCMIELQAGEKLVGEPHIGDAVRWNLSPALYGNAETATSVIVLKPQAPGLDKPEKLKLAFCTVAVPVIFERSSAVSTWFGANAIRTWQFETMLSFWP
jgi:type IV secretion system protein VirB9